MNIWAEYSWITWIVGLIFALLFGRSLWKYYKNAETEDKPRLVKIYIAIALISVVLFTSVYFFSHQEKSESDQTTLNEIIQTQDE